VNLLTIGKLVPLLIFIAAGLFAADPRAFTFAELPPFTELRRASLVLLFAIGGYEFATVPSEEVIDPKRNLPLSLIAGLCISVVLYLLIQLVCQGTLPGLAASPAPLADAAATFLGPPGAILLTAGAVLSTTGTNSTILLVGPRMLYALAQGGQMPAVFGRVHARYRTPHVSVVVFAAGALLIAISGTFAQLAALNAIARLLYSISTCAAVPVLRKRYPAAQRTFTLPGGWLFPALGIAASLFLLTGMDLRQALIGGAGIAAGAALYLFTRQPGTY
jgi:amino acid transporter